MKELKPKVIFEDMIRSRRVLKWFIGRVVRKHDGRLEAEKSHTVDSLGNRSWGEVDNHREEAEIFKKALASVLKDRRVKVIEDY
jgi:hypothetical protein